MASELDTVEGYLAALPEERRTALSGLRSVILENLPEGFVECVSFGMIGYVVPLERYPETYNRQPLMYAALASQKNHMALYLMAVYSDPAQEKDLRDGFAAAGRKLDLGKSCLRFRKLDELPLDAIGRAVARNTPEEFIRLYEAARSRPRPAR